MTDYENTSALSAWIFTAEELVKIRTRANHEAIEFLEQNKKLKESTKTAAATTTNEDGGGNNHNNTTTTATTPKIMLPQTFAKTERANGPIPDRSITKKKYLSPNEELHLIQFYATKLPTLIGPNAQLEALRRPVKVLTTAGLLMKRFYLSNSVMMYDPKAIMVAAAFLACKVEDELVHIKYLEDGTKLLKSHVSLQNIITSEISLLNGIDFDLLCFHPYWTLSAYSNDLRSFKSKNNQDGTSRRYVTTLAVGGDNGQQRRNARDLLGPVHAEAKRIVETVLCTKSGDVGLIATPGQIGLAAMFVANQRLIEEKTLVGDDVVQIDFEGYIQNRFVEKDTSMIWSQVKKLGVVLEEEFSWEEDLQSLKEFHKKLKGCRVWGEAKKKKSKKRKRTEDGGGGTTG